jgi:multidrug resistance efflux pump
MSSPVLSGARRLWVSVFIVLGVLLLLGSTIGANLAWRSPRSSTHVATPPGWENAWEAMGFTDVEDRVTPLYPLQPGQVKTILAHENVPVRKGDRLLQLDDRLARSHVDEAQLAVQEAQEQLLKAQDEVGRHRKMIDAQDKAIKAAQAEHRYALSRHARIKSLQKAGEGSPEDVQSAAALVEKAQAAIEAEEARRDVMESVDPRRDVTRARLRVQLRQQEARQAEDVLNDHVLTAPFDGIPLRVLVSVGQVLGPNPREPAIQFCPNQKRIIRAELEQEFAARVKEGQQVAIADAATGVERWKGSVHRKGDWYTQRRSLIPDPTHFNDLRTLECIIKLDSASEANPPHIGQRVTVKYTPAASE